MNINYSFQNDIIQIVYLMHKFKTSDIIDKLKYYFGNDEEFTVRNIERLKRFALVSTQLTRDVDYILLNGEIIIIDSNTGFKRPRTRWFSSIHEMIEIREGIEPKSPSVECNMITQHGYFNLYKKKIGVTGTIGCEYDENLIKT